VLQLWRDPIQVVITPESVAIRTNKKTLQVIELDPVSSDKPSWENALLAVEQYAHSIKAKQIRFIISNNYVRYAVLPSHSGVYAQNDWHALAKDHLYKVHGSIVGEWEVTVALQGYDKPAIISAIDSALLRRIEALSQQFDWEIDAIEPALMSVVNHYHKKLKSTTVLMMVESNRVVLARIEQSCITHFAVASPLNGNEQLESNKLIQRHLGQNKEAMPEEINVFSDITFDKYSTGGLVTINALSDTTANTQMSAMLAELR